jgi:hypothetical protein
MSTRIIKFPSAARAGSYLNGAAIIDDKGMETPITEQMIQHSMQELLLQEDSSQAKGHDSTVPAMPCLHLI